MKKHRKDSKLWTLTPPVQEELYKICGGPGGYAEAREWLQKNHGVLVRSDSSFTSWWQAYPFSLSSAASFAQTFEREILKLPEMEQRAEEASRLSQAGFEIMALRSKDLEGYATLKKLRLKERSQLAIERRLSLLEQQAAESVSARKVAADATLTPEQQLLRYKQIFGG